MHYILVYSSICISQLFDRLVDSLVSALKETWPIDLRSYCIGCLFIAGLHNSAASCYIVVLIDLTSAIVVGLVGLAHKQVAR